MNQRLRLPKKLRITCALLILLASPAFAQDVRVVEAYPNEAMNGKFIRTDGWIGSDGIYSVPLPDDSTLWIFGDTLVGRIRGGKRFELKMVNNSFARQKGWGNDAVVELLLNRTPAGDAASFIVPKNKNGYFWIWDGIVQQGKLYLFATRLTSPGTITAFDWKLLDQSLIVIDNPTESPSLWEAHQVDLPFGKFTEDYEAIWGIEALSVDGFIYVYGSVRPRKEASRFLAAARFASENFASFDRWTFYKNGEWQRDSTQATALTSEVGTEGSITYLSDRQKYLYVYSPPLDPRIMMRTSSSPVGPWSSAIAIYTCPEAQWDSRIFCYAGKARLVPGTKNELLISYATNSFDMLSHVTADARIYTPRFVTVKLGD